MAQHVSTLMNPPIEDLLDKVDSKFTLVALASRRARQVNSYYNSLGEGIGVVVPPQVASVSGKPLSIAFEEVAAGRATFTRPDPEEEAALAEAAALAALEEAAEAEVEASGAPVEVAAEVAAESSDSDSDADSGSGSVAGSDSDSDAGSGSGDVPTE
jgi:DNA-directed RNA polymerase subunit omega